MSSATNPENGTVSYAYNNDGTLASKTDANNNTETYNYDSYGRLTGIPDRQQTFTYDTCPINATGCVSAPGLMVQTTFASNIGPDQLAFAYNYAYTPAGKAATKTLVVQSAFYQYNGSPSAGSLAVNYSYDNQGALMSMGYPVSTYPGGIATFTYSRDQMERLTGMTDNYYSPRTWATGVTYNAANQMLFDGKETWTYNNLLQATSVTGTGMSMTYNYSATQNNGQIISSVDAATNETITYTYDALKRLIEADGLNWTERYVYDGYGNLTQMNPTGGAPSLSVTVATDLNGVPTNRISATGVNYDNNGNLTQGFGQYFGYDVANRMVTAAGGIYAYDSGNRRIYYRDQAGHDTVYLFGLDGKKLATYTLTFTGSSENYTLHLNYQSNNVYFRGRLFSAEGSSVRTDRLGSVRSGGPGGLGYQAQYPYGAEYSTTANDREKYATYTRDSATGLDYAVNRYYSSQWGRFLSPDPYVANSGGPGDQSDPQTWNRYSYVGGDPIQRNDTAGLWWEIPTGGGEDGGVFIIDDSPEPGASGGQGSGGVGGKKSQFPECNQYNNAGIENELSFLVAHYQAAVLVAQYVDAIFGLSFDASDVLGWAGAETGWKEPQSHDYYNESKAGSWLGLTVNPCADKKWACFGSFQDSAIAAFFGSTGQVGYPSVNYGQLDRVSAGFVLTDQIDLRHSTLGQAFQAVATGGTGAVKGWDPTNNDYGKHAAETINYAGQHLDCLKLYNYVR